MHKIHRGRHRTAGLVAQDHQEVGVQVVERIIQGSQHGGVQDVAGGADDEGIAETDIEDMLDGRTGIRASKDHHAGILALSEPLALINLVEIHDGAVNDTLVSSLEGFPDCLRLVGNVT
nr:hypothetical protein [Corynebacterium accolens]